MSTTFANTINGNPIYAKRAEEDQSGVNIEQNYAKVADLTGKADNTPTFVEASTRSNLAGSGEVMTTILGKIKKWFADLKSLAFKDKVSDSDITGTISDSHIDSATTWNNKQNALSVQTAYSAKGTATTVPQITTNSLGQVTGITEIAISGVTPSSHSHGNIANGGTLQTNDIDIASGDKLVVTDSSDSSKVARTSVSFDGSTTTKALTQKGTFEAFAKSGDITTAIQALDVSSVGGDGKYISAISETDGKISATATTMDTTPTSNSTKAVTSGGIATALAGCVPNSGTSVINGEISINPTIAQGNYNEGIRLNKASNGWSALIIGGNRNSTSGAPQDSGGWFLGCNTAEQFVLGNKNSSTSDAAMYIGVDRKVYFPSGIDGYVPTSRTVNGKALTGNITLSASDVGAATSSHNHDATYMKASSGNKSLSFGGTTTIGTVNNSDVNLVMPNALSHTEYSSTQTPDFNSYTTPGTYALSYSSGSNIPPISVTQRSGPSSGILTVAKSVINSTTVITQVWIDSFYAECVIRRKEGSTWKNWTFPYAGTNISLNSSTYSDQQVTGVLPVANGGTGQTSLANVSVGSATTASGLDSPYITLPKDTRSSPDAFICVVAAKPNSSEMKSYLNATDTKAGVYATYGQAGGWVAYRNTDGNNSWGTANVGDKGHPVFINSKGEFTKCGESIFSAQPAGVVFSKSISSGGAVDIAALPNYCLIALYNNTSSDYSITCGGVSYNLKSKAGKLFFKAGGSVCYGV